ncbi:MAG TPA: hypothetical protein DFK09_03810, partial [Erythrobacter sp.]|nr:hypothetical protein [Erythrobacter sp.]
MWVSNQLESTGCVASAAFQHAAKVPDYACRQTGRTWMAEPKTQPRETDPADFLATVEPARKREEAR